MRTCVEGLYIIRLLTYLLTYLLINITEHKKRKKNIDNNSQVHADWTTAHTRLLLAYLVTY